MLKIKVIAYIYHRYKWNYIVRFADCILPASSGKTQQHNNKHQQNYQEASGVKLKLNNAKQYG